MFQSNVTLLMCVNLWPSVSLWYVSSSNRMHHCDVWHPYIRCFDCQWTHSSMTLQLIIRSYNFESIRLLCWKYMLKLTQRVRLIRLIRQSSSTILTESIRSLDLETIKKTHSLIIIRRKLNDLQLKVFDVRVGFVYVPIDSA